MFECFQWDHHIRRQCTFDEVPLSMILPHSVIYQFYTHTHTTDINIPFFLMMGLFCQRQWEILGAMPLWDAYLYGPAQASGCCHHGGGILDVRQPFSVGVFRARPAEGAAIAGVVWQACTQCTQCFSTVALFELRCQMVDFWAEGAVVRNGR
jgi:hypothetical protein